MQIRRVALGAALSVGLIAGGGAAAMQVRKNIQEQQGVERLASLCRDINQDIQDNGRVVKVSSGAQPVAVLGDSYAAGDFLDQPSDGWVSHLGKAEGWATSVSGIGGTGFINGGPCGTQQFSTRVSDVLASDPQTVIVQGGLNDHGKPQEAIDGAVTALLRDLADVPDVIVVGPTNAPAIADDEPVDAAMKSAAERAGRAYISAYGWDLPYLPDGVHMTKDGHASYAEKLAAAVPDISR